MPNTATSLIPHIVYPYRKYSRYSEKDAAVVVRQMLKVAAECHLHGLVHRDMKPEVYSKSARWNWAVKIKRSYEIMHYIVLPELPLQVIKGGLPPQGNRFWPFRFYKTRCLYIL